ncbi:hypothetical protein TPR58_04350 [Sphingomonas sp. HF-S3]|uniref:DUF4281 domain-containing protein n=2 Tax=Sphingomonas rustica TaxID=3103142 RepID=A0ABV0B477_9SPHN
MPVTILGAFSWSMFFWLLPGLNGLVLAGRHRWRDVGLSVLALVIHLAGMIAVFALREQGMLTGIWRQYAYDLVLVLTVTPLVKVMMDQQATVEMRRILRR